MKKMLIVVIGAVISTIAYAQNAAPELTQEKRNQVTQEANAFAKQWQSTNGAAINQAVNGEKPTKGTSPEINKAIEDGVNFAKGSQSQFQPTK